MMNLWYCTLYGVSWCVRDKATDDMLFFVPDEAVGQRVVRDHNAVEIIQARRWGVACRSGGEWGVVNAYDSRWVPELVGMTNAENAHADPATAVVAAWEWLQGKGGVGK